MPDDRRDAKGRYSDLEVAAVEAHFARLGCPARDEAELQALLGTFEAASIVHGVRLDRLRAEVEAQMFGLDGLLWRRFPRTSLVVLRATAAGLRLLQRFGIMRRP